MGAPPSSAAPAAAEGPLDAAAFEAVVEGRTVVWSTDKSTPYGREHYYPGRAVTWAWAGGECQAGTWYEDRPDGPGGEPAICFVYDGDGRPICWRFFLQGGELMAFDLKGGAPLYEIEADKGLACGGVGV